MLGVSGSKGPNNQPYSTRVPCESLTTGFMVNPTTMAAKWTTTKDVSFIINYRFRRITIIFSTYKAYKAEFTFQDLEVHSLHPEEFKGEKRAYFTLIAKHPPQYWKALHPLSKRIRYDDMPWIRATRIAMDKQTASHIKKASPTPLERQETVTQCLALGEWTTFRVCISLDGGGSSQSRKAFKSVLWHAISSRLVPRPSVRNRCDKKFTVLNAYNGTTTTTSATIPNNILENFDMYYTLESYFSYRILIPATIDETFYALYAKMTPIEASRALQYLTAMVDTGFLDDDNDDEGDDDDDDEGSPGGGSGKSGIDTRHIWKPTEALRDVVKNTNFANNALSREKSKHKDQVMIRKVLVTPTTLLFELPQNETDNRVLRYYKNHIDRFIRVQFIEEGQHRLQTSSRPNHTSTKVYQRISHALKYGIQIGNRHYEFLAYSSSQLREHGCWFFASTDTLNADMIRSWMGDFSGERIVAKYAARMGQCFSSTSPTVELKKHQIQKIKDITRNGYTFSDGAGRISTSLAKRIAIRMGKPKGAAYTSAFQFRMGGAKGTLTTCPDMKDDTLALRPSQEKFDSSHRMLEINRLSTRSIASLNRQIIVILSTLGVADHVFLDLLRELLQELNYLKSDPERCIATLRANSDEDGISRDMIALVKYGFLASGDPYIARLLHAYRLHRLKEVKKRAKIPVAKGAHLLGVMDETCTLKENEVFCHLSGSSDPITGKCLVFRLPALHPGDARILKAVKCSNLKHLRNVIVFSSKGERDVPSMLAGGDLDGDTYSIIWDKRLYPSKKMRNREPMDVTPLKPKEVDKVEITHIRKFLVEYIENDNLGLIANAHLALADAFPLGVSDPICMELAQLHSHAVDYPKTGRKATLDGSLRPLAYPDFMEKNDKPSYESQKILGQLYRNIDSGEFQHYRDKLRVKDTEYDTRLRYPGMEKYFDFARQMKWKYDSELKSLMNQYGVPTEAEFMTGCIIRYNHHERKEYELRSMVRKEMIQLKERWRRDAFTTLQKKAGKKARFRTKDIERDYARAAAFYYVTYRKDEQEKAASRHGGQRKNHTLLLSFAWLAQDLLCDIIRRYPYGEQEEQEQPIR